MPSPYTASVNEKAVPMSGMMSSNIPTTPVAPPLGQYNPAIYDIKDPYFNMDLASLNFVNQYGALELGMLGHMSSGLSDPSPDDVQMMSPPVDDFAASAAMPTVPLYDDASVQPDVTLDSTAKADVGWQQQQEQQQQGQQIPAQENAGQPPSGIDGLMAPPDQLDIPLGYTIDAEPDDVTDFVLAMDQKGASPFQSNDHGNIFPPSSMTATTNQQTGLQRPASTTQASQEQQQKNAAQEQAQISQARLNATLSTLHAQNAASRKRRLDASSVYKTVKQPYNYINGFHNLFLFLQNRFSREKRSRIAKALAAIRPPFISCTQNLNGQDLVYMEKCFQRTLREYEEFINMNGTPTIICRRTGEVAAVSREFTLLTGWKKEVLLGKQPNLNVNHGQGLDVYHSEMGSRMRHGNESVPVGNTGNPGNSGNTGNTANPPAHTPGTPSTSASSQTSSANTSANSSVSSSPACQPRTAKVPAQPVLLAELLDDDSVVRFYEDFAQLAFGDSRGSVVAPGKLLRYRTKADVERSAAGASVAGVAGVAGKRAASASGSTPASAPASAAASMPASAYVSASASSSSRLDGASGVMNAGRTEATGSRKASSAGVESSGGGSAGSAGSIGIKSATPATPATPATGPGNLVHGETGLQALGDRTGCVDCMLCWTVKRDMFDVPMLIVMNVGCLLLDMLLCLEVTWFTLIFALTV